MVIRQTQRQIRVFRDDSRRRLKIGGVEDLQPIRPAHHLSQKC